MIRLSFIVPFYGVEQYIEECIRSLYDQDIPMEEYEVICVDDRSPDGSRAIVERLQKEYPTLKLMMHKENKRQGGARNTGLKEANGKYIWFVDSDDCVESNCLKWFLSEMDEADLDMLQFDYIRIGKRKIKIAEKESDVMSGEEYLFVSNSTEWVEKVNGPWMQIFKREFIEKNRLEFVENVQYEDTDYMLSAFLKAERVKYIPEVGYYYRCNEDSTTQSKNPIKIAWMVNQFVRCYQLIEQAQSEKAKAAVQDFVAQSLSFKRIDIKKLDNQEKRMYLANIEKRGIRTCRACMTWKTYLAIRHAITCFV